MWLSGWLCICSLPAFLLRVTSAVSAMHLLQALLCWKISSHSMLDGPLQSKVISPACHIPALQTPPPKTSQDKILLCNGFEALRPPAGGTCLVSWMVACCLPLNSMFRPIEHRSELEVVPVVSSCEIPGGGAREEATRKHLLHFAYSKTPSNTPLRHPQSVPL